MLKHLLFILITSLSVNCATAQADSTKLLFAKKFQSDAFVELGSRIKQVNNKAGMDIDFSANWLINHKYYLGGAYSQLANVEEFSSADKLSPLVFDQSTQIKYQTAGVRIGYVLFENQKIISFSPDLTAGWAGITLITKATKQKIGGGYFSPALKGVFNISSYLRIGVSVNYNVFIFKEFDSTNLEENPYITHFTSKSLNGVGGGVFLRIGQF